MIYKIKHFNHLLDEEYRGYICNNVQVIADEEWYCIKNEHTSVKVYLQTSENIIYNIVGTKADNVYIKNAFIEYLKFLEKTDVFVSVCFFDFDSILFQFLVNYLEIHRVSINGDKMIISFYISKQNNEIPIDECEDLIERSKTLIKILRKAYYSKSSRLTGLRERPLFGNIKEGMPTDSLGPFPEFILPTLPCQKTLNGFCAPCFFSKVEMAEGAIQDIKNSMVIQTKYIIEHFDEIVLNYQTRQKGVLKDTFDITFCYACNGSIFSNYETTREARYKSFKLLDEEIRNRGLKALVYLETCVDDYLSFLESDEIRDLLPIFQNLNVVILCGFESVDAYIRDVLYVKDMKFSDFQKVIRRNREFGIETGAFLYRGFHSLTQNEIIQDTVRSLAFLCANGVMPVIMLPNLQEYTLTHLLYSYEQYNIIDPLTALEIVKITMWFTKSVLDSKKDRWLMGDLFGGPPKPRNSVFTNKRKIVCDECAETIRKSLQQVRLNNDINEIENALIKVKNCKCGCYKKYLAKLEEEEMLRNKIPLRIRGKKSIEFAFSHVYDYLNNNMYPIG